MVSLDKVCEWLENECENKGEYIGGIFGGPCSIRIMFENISKDLRKAMDQQIMWKALIKIVEKWACMHEMHLRLETYENFHTRQVWVCWKCGKIKKIKL